MRQLHLYLLIGIAAAVMSTGCQRKASPTPIEGLELHKDEITKFEMKVPSNWRIQEVEGELLVAVSKPGAGRRFLNFKADEGGAKVELRALRVDSTHVMDSLIINSKLEFEDGLDRYELTDATLGGKPAKKLSVAFDQEDGEYRSEQYFAENDSVITMVTLASFGNNFSDYENDFNEILKSVKLAQRPAEKPKVDTLTPTGPEPPSDTLTPYSAKHFAIKIPKNFDGKKAEGSGLGSVNFVGSRLDCNIQVDVFDASKQKNLDKIIDQNKPNYGGQDAKATTLNGKKAKYFSYNPTGNISSRAYFSVVGDKLFRITVNWYKPEQSVYLPIFEKCIASVTFK